MDIRMNIELRHLKHLAAVAEHASFSRAAEALHITQPALSRSIQGLEAQVGGALFERQRGGIEPTDLGRLLLRHAKAFEASTQDLEHEIRLARGLALGELRIGVGPFGGSALIGPVVGRLNRLHPGLRVQLLVAPWQELPERARARDVDLIVLDLSEVEQLEDFASQALSPHQAVVVCRAGHPLAALPAPGLDDLFSYPLAGPRLPPHAAKALAAGMPAERRTALRGSLLTLECDSSSVLKAMLVDSDAVSMMPRFMVQAEIKAGLLTVIDDIELGTKARFGVAWLRQRTVSGAGLKFIELLAAHDVALAGGRRNTKRRRPQPR
jgi:DNA-binding transcriptional LysR family regulator